MPHNPLKRTTNGVQEQYRVHLLGFDHTQVTFRFKGHDHCLTDLQGHIVNDLLV